MRIELHHSGSRRRSDEFSSVTIWRGYPAGPSMRRRVLFWLCIAAAWTWFRLPEELQGTLVALIW